MFCLLKETKEALLKEKEKKMSSRNGYLGIGFLRLHVPSSGHSHSFHLQSPSATLSQ